MRYLLPFLFSVPLFALQAETRLPLAEGMTPSQVKAKWGEPKSVVEKEIRRERVWIYKDKKRVVFREGQLVSWDKSVPGEEITEIKQLNPPGYEETPFVETSDTLDLVRDIAKEVPSGPDSPGGGSSDAPNLVPVPPAPVPAQPQALPGFQGFQGPPPVQQQIFDDEEG